MALNTSTGELCLTTSPRGCFSTTVYNFTITDVTGYATLTVRNIQDGECTQIEFSNSECAPYDIAIDAYNPLVTYQTVSRTDHEGQGELIRQVSAIV